VPIDLTDEQIKYLVSEPKPLPSGYRERILTLRPRNAHQSGQLTVIAESGNSYELIARQGQNPLDFSLIVAYNLPSAGRLFRLRRYNGKSHMHGNRIEGDSFYDFHIHVATMRYQARGGKEDSYAEVTDRYTNLAVALECAVQDCGFIDPIPQIGIRWGTV
jgi:hypothetical protein